MASNGSVDHPSVAGIRLVLGGNVFGWTIDQDRSFAVLDAFYEAGGRMIDTAEGYSSWVPGNKGGESETIIGAWLESRGVRAEMRIGTKTGMGGPPGALRPEAVASALAGSLQRLRTDYLDLYYIHRDDRVTPLDEVVSAYDVPYREGKVRELGVSNYEPGRLVELNAAARASGAQPFTVVQPLYNLVARNEYEGALQDLCVRQGIAVMPYYGLAAGFLTGKYENAAQWAGSARARSLDDAAANGGWATLERLRTVARDVGAEPVEVALAWINAQPGIAAPIASATAPKQVMELAHATALDLSPAQLQQLGLSPA
ncbi:aryl-alcohol dehydrogenase-like predicted oxidoreductase [Novosphingobium chloroacetimidivorans]|uniref:Aryl-alcohol dehydrogenase-like predicted oxidoreductase n=1 Tax=Novosphingobium chloroacetimidivorans TaxID=1428314 RepID=A0A7W7NY25_9SPHN|nr:aldo/keto reductase [Novosphingobium chloroacetimidivorans]MBB4859747.1 aryl-alcohol dehydrogenase-like predicted oxidoreductase [Novosphingobium chloroacetimidivorans]